MFVIIRNALVAAVIATLGSMGVSFAVTGSVNPVNLATHASASLQAGVSTSDSENGSQGPAGDETTATGSSAVSPTGGHDPERSTNGCGPSFTPGDHFNHGQFVSQSQKGDHGRSEAAKSDCGKPVQATEHADQNENEAPEAPETEHSGQPQTAEHDHGKSGENANTQGGDHGDSHGHGHGDD